MLFEDDNDETDILDIHGYAFNPIDGEGILKILIAHWRNQS